MQFGVITLFPEMFDAVTGYGITGRAVSSGLLSVQCFNPRQWTQDRHQTVDDRPYGGGPGMVMQIEPLRGAIHEARRALGDATPVAYLSPQGQRLDQAQVRQLAKRESMILLAGRYEGVDERLLASEVDEEWSLGDYVLSGGELPAMVLIDAVARLQAGALGHERSHKRIRSRMDCWIARTSLARKHGGGGQCLRCCAAAITRPFAAGD
jgi:tRNA (guanine37-N1)-methyltransferase